MMSFLLLQGFLLGALNAAPVGPVGVLCLRKMADADRWSGYCAALGMAFAYGIVAFCVAFGLKGIAQFLELHRMGFQLIAGAALLLFGWRGLRGEPERATGDRKSVRGYAAVFAASFTMTLVNPLPFASFAVMVTSLGMLKGLNLGVISDIEFGVAVSAGAAFFWVLLRQVLVWVRRRWKLDIGAALRKGSALALLVFGIAMLVAAMLPTAASPLATP